MNINTGITAARWTSSLTAVLGRSPRTCYKVQRLRARGLTSTISASQSPDNTPLRKHLKDEAKRKKALARDQKQGHGNNGTWAKLQQEWELTVGIEVHAQLNTASKLFSNASTSDGEIDSSPNSHVALFDAAMPGSQPNFQVATLLPAVRAALALRCEIQPESAWDRKHYFHWDQPNGYQITQYYRPFAKDGQLVLTAADGIPQADLHGDEHMTIGIKQIQMEQDTAKTLAQPDATYHIDLNRAGHPLIEIITLPQIHSPQTAAAVVKKLQRILKSVDACVVGMELGGLRADINVSVRRRGTTGGHAYSGVSGLGQRTEIKNLSSHKAVQDAVEAEYQRQVSVLRDGGQIVGETRGWTLGATDTTRLRGKEGEVDYRYIPEADLPALIIGSDLTAHLQSTLPELPDQTVLRVCSDYHLTEKDANTLVNADDGERLDFLEETVHLLRNKLDQDHSDHDEVKIGKAVGNYIVHEVSAILTTFDRSWSGLSITPDQISDLIFYVLSKQITNTSAKQLLQSLITDSSISSKLVRDLIEERNLFLRPMSEEDYEHLARLIMDENPDMVSAVRNKAQRGKIMWFVGQMVRRGDDGTVEPDRARKIIERMMDM